MTFERMPGAPEPGLPPTASDAASGATSTPVQIRLQILTTEHWSLLASRSLAWNEAFARAGMYLSTLSASIVALGLIGGIDHFGDGFFSFAFVVLPVVFFIGIGTWLRMGTSNYHDAQTIYGMNRIRGAYVQIAPDVEPYFVMGTHDDPAGIGITMAVPPGLPVFVHLISSTPFLVVTLNAVVAGALAAMIIVRLLGGGNVTALLGAIAAALLVLAFEILFARRTIGRLQGSVRPMFPTPLDQPRDPVARELL
jgi:hypothetical protein